jgi:uncharacterized membrane protein
MVNLHGTARWLVARSMPGVTAASGLAVLVLLLGPLLVGQPPTQRFLAWNLGLAWIPYLTALALEALDRAGRPFTVVCCAAVWFLFLPNAPYLVSDLTHLHQPSPTPWLDLARFVAFAWAGCLLAVASVQVVHGVVARRAGSAAGWAVVVGGAAASGVGIALGRFARLNSWEAVTRPTTVAGGASRLAESEQAVAVAAFFALLLLVVYAGFGRWRPAEVRR